MGSGLLMVRSAVVPRIMKQVEVVVGPRMMELSGKSAKLSPGRWNGQVKVNSGL